MYSLCVSLIIWFCIMIELWLNYVLLFWIMFLFGSIDLNYDSIIHFWSNFCILSYGLLHFCLLEMKRNKLPSNISLQYLINEVKKQEQKERNIKYLNCVTNTPLQTVNKDIWMSLIEFICIIFIYYSIYLVLFKKVL